jgi:EpsI family protein
LAIDLKKAAIVLVCVLAMQSGGYLLVARDENPPAAKPLNEFPTRIGDWSLQREGVIEQRVQEKLRADDLLTRSYLRDAGSGAVHLFVAYFRSQRTGQAPHSPKNCLPGSGWTPTIADMIELPIQNRTAVVNRYEVSKGENKSIVLYWYQTGERIVASEYLAKIHLVMDSVLRNRSDTALVRVIVPVSQNDTDAASETAVSFAAELLTSLDEFPQFQDKIIAGR